MEEENQEIVRLVVTSTISLLSRKFRVKKLCFSLITDYGKY
jgi:hypothetical protein